MAQCEQGSNVTVSAGYKIYNDILSHRSNVSGWHVKLWTRTLSILSTWYVIEDNDTVWSTDVDNHGQRTSSVKIGVRKTCALLVPTSDHDTDIGISQLSNISTQYSCHSHSGCVYKRFNLTSSSWPDTSASTNRSINSRTWADSGSIAVPLSWAEI